MKGVEVLGEITEVTKSFNSKPFGGWILLIIGIICAIFFFSTKEFNIYNYILGGLSAIAITVSIFYFGTKESCTHYLIHLTDEASYNEFNSTYEIVNEICDGYYEVKEIKGDIND